MQERHSDIPLNEVLELAKLCARQDGKEQPSGFLSRIPSRAELEQLDAEGFLHTANRDGKIVGFASALDAVSELPEMAATREKFLSINWREPLPSLDMLVYCDQCAVHPQWRKQGIATQLLEAITQSRPEHSLLAAVIEEPAENLASTGVLKSYGFIKVGEREAENYRGFDYFRSAWYLLRKS